MSKALLISALVVAVCLPALGQTGKNAKPPKDAGKVVAPNAATPSIAQQKAKAPAQIPNAQLNRLMNMTPEQRERLLANVKPERREELMRRLERLDQLTPEQKAQLNWRFQELQKLTPARQQAIRAEMQTLRGLRQPQRRQRIQSPEFREQYSPEEIQLMKDVWNIP